MTLTLYHFPTLPVSIALSILNSPYYRNKTLALMHSSSTSLTPAPASRQTGGQDTGLGAFLSRLRATVTTSVPGAPSERQRLLADLALGKSLHTSNRFQTAFIEFLLLVEQLLEERTAKAQSLQAEEDRLKQRIIDDKLALNEYAHVWVFVVFTFIIFIIDLLKKSQFDRSTDGLKRCRVGAQIVHGHTTRAKVKVQVANFSALYHAARTSPLNDTCSNDSIAKEQAMRANREIWNERIRLALEAAIEKEKAKMDREGDAMNLEDDASQRLRSVVMKVFEQLDKGS